MIILFALNPRKLLNSTTTYWIFLINPSLQCQSNLNLGLASGFSSPPSSPPSAFYYYKPSKTLEGRSLKSKVNISKNSFSNAPSTNGIFLVFPAPNPFEMDSIIYFWVGFVLWSIANI